MDVSLPVSKFRFKLATLRNNQILSISALCSPISSPSKSQLPDRPTDESALVDHGCRWQTDRG